MYEIVQPSAELIRPIPEDIVLLNIEEAARTCYRSEHKIEPGSAEKLFDRLIDRGHLSPLEHEKMTVRIVCDRGCCYSADTEVLTKSGWKAWPLVTKTDKLACLTDNEELEWHKATRLFEYDYRDNMLAFETSSIDLLVTPNHRMWVFDYDKRSPVTKIWKFVEAKNLTNGRYIFAKSAKWTATPAAITIPKHRTKFWQFPEINYNEFLTADFFELLGLWATDGYYRRSSVIGRAGEAIAISQRKQNVRQRITDLCARLNLHIAWQPEYCTIDNSRLMGFVVSLFGEGAKTYTVRVPSIIKQASITQIKRFLQGVVAGDGNVHSANGHTVVYTASKGFADDLQELFMKIGLSANIRKVKPRLGQIICGVPVKTIQQNYVVSVHRKKRCNTLLDRRCARKFAAPIPYDGKVYCAEVPYHRLYVRRNGKPCWSGNSHELVRHRIMSVSQESTRYCNYGNDQFRKTIKVIEPVLGDDNKGICGTVAWRIAMAESARSYFDMLACGITPQIARSVLPNSLATNIVVTANIREWYHIFDQRLSPAAHPDMQRVMHLVLDEMLKVYPFIYKRYINDSM